MTGFCKQTEDSADHDKRWLSPAALDLVEGLLFYDPSQRLLADSALRTDYFLIEEPAMEKPTQYVQLYPCHPQSLQSSSM